MNNKYIDKTWWMHRLICAISVSTWYEHIKILDLVCINAKLANIAEVLACCSLNRRLTRAGKILIRNKKKSDFFYRIFFFFVFFFYSKFLLIYLNSHVSVMRVKFVVGRINGMFDGVETETRKIHHKV